jgi:hypothetical protein
VALVNKIQNVIVGNASAKLYKGVSSEDMEIERQKDRETERQRDK